MIALIAALLVQSGVEAPQKDQAAADAAAIVPFFESVVRQARVLGSCSAFNEPAALNELGDRLLALPEIKDVAEDVEGPFRSMLAETYAEGRTSPIEAGLTEERCASLTQAAEAEVAEALTSLQAVVEDIETSRPARN